MEESQIIRAILNPAISKQQTFQVGGFSLQVGCVDSLLQIDISLLKKGTESLRFS